ncbi:very short patch repair endonuclease [Flagellimonas sp.]|uniref:very short patch repair endonuclease n=1 Tax=Flagellimonas sp. TaxID=2058762 RepID=UPI003AB2BE3B
MTDIHTAEIRRKCMSSIPSKNTGPEKFLRSALHRAGLRFRLHDKSLPSSPDIVLRKYRAVIFVHGCYWHSHGCYKSTIPATRREFWLNKFKTNRERDQRDVKLLLDSDWRVLIVWECALKGKTSMPIEKIASAVDAWLHSSETYREIPQIRSGF